MTECQRSGVCSGCTRSLQAGEAGRNGVMFKKTRLSSRERMKHEDCRGIGARGQACLQHSDQPALLGRGVSVECRGPGMVGGKITDVGEARRASIEGGECSG